MVWKLRRGRLTRTTGREGRFLTATLVAVLLALPGCFTLTHTVGAGPVGGHTEYGRQWYALWGIAPLGETDSSDLARGAIDYQVTTKFTVADVVISAFTSFVGFYRQTIIVEK